MGTNRIRGITVEIGGDTTKLDKALSGTDKALASTQRSLKDVERLLKMDPGNTELLAQKQRLLADAAEGTKKRLDTLKEAAKGADAALSRNAAYEEKYAPLQQKIESVSATLKGLEANQEQMERAFSSGRISAASYEQFRAKVEDTRQTLEQLGEAQKDLEKEFSGAKLNQGQYDALQRELVETEDAAKDAEKAFRDFDATAQKVSAGAGKIAEGASSVRDATSGISKAAGGILAAAVATVPATEEFRAGMANLKTNADEAEVSMNAAESAMKNFIVVSGEMDSSLEATSNLLQAGFTESNLQKAVENLSGAALKFPDTLKIESLADSLQETIATGEATGQFAELLDRLGVSSERVSEQLALIPSEVDRGNYALDLLANEGLAESYEAWLKNNDAIVQSRAANYEFQSSMAQLAQTIQPFLTQLVEFFTMILDWFNQLPPQVQTFIGIILLLVAAISPVAGIISAIGLAVAGTGASMTAFLPVIIAVTAALVALAAIIAIISGKSDDLDKAVKTAGSVSVGGGETSRTGRAALRGTEFPAFATGGVVRPNSPFLAVLGDNTRETEVVSPLSTIRDALLQAMDARDGGGSAARTGSQSLTLNMVIDGSKFARLIVPYLNGETGRAGVNILGR